jgi:hypothetical protein
MFRAPAIPAQGLPRPKRPASVRAPLRGHASPHFSEEANNCFLG